VTGGAATVRGLEPHSFLQGLVLFGGVGIGSVATYFLSKKGVKRWPALAALLAVGIALLVWGTSKSWEGHPQKQSQQQPLPPSPKQPAEPMSLGSKPGEMVSTPWGLLAATANGLSLLDPEVPNAPAKTVRRGPPITHVAAHGHMAAFARGRTVRFYNIAHDRMLPRRINFDGDAGPLAVGHGSAWICNPSRSKVDRYVFSIDGLFEVPVPERATAVLATKRYVFAGTVDGHLVRIDPRADPKADPFPMKGQLAGRVQALAYGLGYVWAVDSDDDLLYRLTIDGDIVGKPIELQGGVVALAIWKGYVWALSSAEDDILRVSRNGVPSPDDVKVPRHPTALVVHDGRLYVASRVRGSATEVKP
jgi:hypothetical protein